MKNNENKLASIPKNWTYVTVRDVIEKISLTNKKVKKRDYLENGNFPVIDQGQKFIGGYTNNKKMLVNCELPTIIFGDHTKVVKYVDFPFVAGADGVKVIRPEEAFLPKLFFYFLQAIQLPDKGYARHFQYLEKSLIPVPPLPEQGRIVSRLEELLTKLDAGVESIRTVKAQLQLYRQAVLKHAFNGKLTEEWRRTHKDMIEPASTLLEQKGQQSVKIRRGVPEVVELPEELETVELPETWELVAIASLLRNGFLLDLKDGNHGTNHPKSSEFGNDGLPFITASDVRDYIIDYDSASKLKGAPLKRLKVGFSFPDDVILTHKGTVGRVAVSDRECVLSPQTTYYRVDANFLNNKYLAYALSSPIFQTQLTRTKSQTTRDFVSITKQYHLFIPYMGISEQNMISEEIETRFSPITQIAKVVEQSLLQSKVLRQSILKTAFEGRLVVQDPSDEPADVLLERTRKEKERHSDQKKGTRRRKTGKRSQRRLDGYVE